jgi:hypothetical protein
MLMQPEDPRTKRRRPNRSALRNPTILMEMICHCIMGIALGFGFAMALTLIDAFGIATLIAHSLEPLITLTIFVGTFTLAFAVGATLTGFVFTMMEER